MNTIAFPGGFSIHNLESAILKLMRENDRFEQAKMAAETLYLIWEAEYQQGNMDIDALMCHLKDLSAYSLTHAEILSQREGAEMLAIALFFGMTEQPAYQVNRERIFTLSQETFSYQGQEENIKRKVTNRVVQEPLQQDEVKNKKPVQKKLI